MKLLLGIRQEFFTDVLNYKTNNETRTTQHAFIPRIGAVVTINKNLTYMGHG